MTMRIATVIETTPPVVMMPAVTSVRIVMTTTMMMTMVIVLVMMMMMMMLMTTTDSQTWLIGASRTGVTFLTRVKKNISDASEEEYFDDRLISDFSCCSPRRGRTGGGL